MECKWLNWLVYCNGKVKAGFANEIDAREYASMMRTLARTAGYKDKYTVVEEKIKIIQATLEYHVKDADERGEERGEER